MKKYADKLISRICDEIQRLGQIYDTKKVYTDFLTVSAICVSNAICCNWFTEREALYTETMKRYKPEHRKVFADMFEKLLQIFELSFINYTDIFSIIADRLAVRRKDLKQNDGSIVCIDYRMSGVGSASCGGQQPVTECRINAGEKFDFTINIEI